MDLNDKIYQYGDTFYSFEEIYQLYSQMGFEKKKPFKNCIAHFVLSQILRKGNYDKYADYMESISKIEKKQLDRNVSKIETFLYKKEYLLKVKILFGINGIVNKYKISEFANGEWLLNKLISLTIGSSQTINECEDFSLIDLDSLTMEECHFIGENFQRNMQNKELLFHQTKRLEKERKLI